MLRENLAYFGLEDVMDVCGAIGVRSLGKRGLLRTEYSSPMLLSNLCLGHARNEIEQAQIDKKAEYLELDMSVQLNGVDIGNVDSDGRFHYSGAPDLRTCLAWIASADAGLDMLLSSFPLIEESERIAKVIAKAPLDEDEVAIRSFYFDSFFRCMEASALRGPGFFDATYCCAMPALWQVGTRTLLNNEHAGFTVPH